MTNEFNFVSMELCNTTCAQIPNFAYLPSICNQKKKIVMVKLKPMKFLIYLKNTNMEHCSGEKETKLILK